MQKFNMPTLKFMVFLAILTGLANACKGIKYNNDDDNDEPIPDLNLTEENKQESYFVFGDSLSTGAVTHPDTVIDAGAFLKMARDKERFPVSPSDFGNGTDDTHGEAIRIRGGSDEDFFASLGSDLSDQFNDVIEVPTYSWSSQLADLTAQSGLIEIAAQNGARASAGEKQVQNLLQDFQNKQKPLTLPEKVFIFFSGNDMCRDGGIAEMTSADDYKLGLEKTIRALLEGFEFPDSGSKFYIVSHLDLIAFFNNEDRFKGKVVKTPGGQEMTCHEYLGSEPKLFEGGGLSISQASINDFANQNLYHPQQICKSLVSMVPNVGLNPLVTDEEASQVQESYRAASRDLVESIQAEIQEKNANSSIQIISSTESLNFGPDDIANDCFHLSVHGQKKIAEAVQSEL